MAVRFLLDENLESEVFDRLEAEGFDVEHVTTVPELGKGATDESLIEYSARENRVIVTYDDDFVPRVGDTFGIVYIEDASLPPSAVARVLTRMGANYPASAFEGLEFASRDWL